jgi:hypothetical protein
LNIPSGTAVRFEPGETKSVSLVRLAGSLTCHGGNGISNGKTSLEEVMAHVRDGGFLHEDYPRPPEEMSESMQNKVENTTGLVRRTVERGLHLKR